MLQLNLFNNSLDAEAAKALAPAIASSSSLTSIALLGNRFDDETVSMLLKVKAEKPTLITLCGLKPDQTEASFFGQGLGPPDAKLLAPELAVHSSLTSVDLSRNVLGPAGAKALVEGGAFTSSLTEVCALCLSLPSVLLSPLCVCFSSISPTTTSMQKQQKDSRR